MSNAEVTNSQAELPLLHPRPRPLRKHLRHLRYTLRVLASGFSPKETLFIYTMGKVGTKSYERSLRELEGYNVFSLGFLNYEFEQEYVLGRGNLLKPTAPVHRIGDKLLYQMFFARPGRRCFLITGVRDPMAQLASRFYHTFSDWYRNADTQAEALAKWLPANVDSSLAPSWFDREFKTVTGVDVYDYPFDIQSGWSVIEQGQIKCLIIKLESPDASKTEAIEDFLGIEGLKLVRQNVRANKDRLGGYERFMRNLRLEPETVEALLRTQYVQHFYSKAEQEEMRMRWIGATGSSATTNTTASRQ